MKAFDFEQVSLIRGQHPILHDISWTVQPQENWAILGLNGAGKTMLLQLLSGYLWPSGGRLEVLGEVFGQTSIPALQRKIGWVSSALKTKIPKHDTAAQVVLSGKFASLGLYEAYTVAELTEAKKLLCELGGSAFAEQPYQTLSQGQQQLVLIARALMAQPELLILDEPCNGLDLFARETLLQQIEAIATSPTRPTVLYVTHYTEEILPCFQKLLLLKQGTVFAQGARETLFTPEKLTAFYEEKVNFLPFSPHRFAVYPALNS